MGSHINLENLNQSDYILKWLCICLIFQNALLKPAKTVFTLPSKKTDDDQKPWFLDIKKEDYIYQLPKVRKDSFVIILILVNCCLSIQ